MYVRLFVADLFVHGIGGAIYDQLTDAIIRRYFGFDAPTYQVLTATVRLPLPGFNATEADCRRLHRAARDLFWNPQRHVSPELVGEKGVWIKKSANSRFERRERFRILRRLTEQLRPSLAGQRKAVLEELAQCEEALLANATLRRRDFAAVLFASDQLRPFVTRYLAV
jgi:hypothetical protein